MRRSLDRQQPQYPFEHSYTVFAQPSFQATPAGGNLTGGSASSGTQTPLYSYSISGGSGSSGYDPTGNVLSYSDSVTGTWTTTSGGTSCATNTLQTSGYDCLNRLTMLQNTATTATSTQYAGVYVCWSYDAFGNRTAQGIQTSPCASPVPATASYNANNQVAWTTVNAAANGFSYDAAGDVTNDNVNQYLYDGEGRICAVTSTPAPGLTTMTGYVYDADGNRVAKGAITSWSCDPTVNGLVSAENETEYILDLDGRPASEMAQDDNGEMQWQRSYVYAGDALIGVYAPAPNPAYNPANPAGVSPVVAALSFRLTDWQGTLRVTTDASGVLQGTCAGLPFGDQVACQGAIADPHYFTGKERDAETGNDFFGARYYMSNMGRFLTPDWAAKPVDVPYASFGDPQTLNLYAYVENAPLDRVDADGHADDMQGTPVNPINPGGGCVSFSAPTPDCAISFATDIPEENAREAAYVAQVQEIFASSGNKMAQQQNQHLSPIDKVAMKAEAGALKLTRQALAGGHSAEYGGLILSRDSNGSLSSTSPIHTGETTVDIDSISVPKGYSVVGEYHTHPSTTCCESVGPSVPDVVRLRTPENASRIGYVGDAFTGQVSRYTQREPITGPYDTHTYGTVIGTIP